MQAAPPRWRQAALGVYLGLLVFVTLWPREYVDAYVSDGIQRRHAWIHILAFAGLAVCSLWAAGRPRSTGRTRRTVWWAASLFGVLLEWLQGALPGINRTCSVVDMRNNAIGAALGVLLMPRSWWAAPEGRSEGSKRKASRCDD